MPLSSWIYPLSLRSNTSFIWVAQSINNTEKFTFSEDLKLSLDNCWESKRSRGSLRRLDWCRQILKLSRKHFPRFLKCIRFCNFEMRKLWSTNIENLQAHTCTCDVTQAPLSSHTSKSGWRTYNYHHQIGRFSNLVSKDGKSQSKLIEQHILLTRRVRCFRVSTNHSHLPSSIMIRQQIGSLLLWIWARQ